jgi:hypothetical protein
MREKLILVIFLTLLLFPPASGIVFADDPGNPDTCRVPCLDLVSPEQQVVIPVTIYNDEALGGIAVPLNFGHAPFDVVCDSVSFADTRITDADIVGAIIDTANYKLVFYVIYLSTNLPAGDGIVANLFFTTGPNWDTTLCVQLDSTFYPPTNRLEFTPRATGQVLRPKFIKGCLNSGLPPVPTLFTPTDDSYECSQDTFKFIWSKSLEVNYTLQYAQDPDFTTGVVTISGLTDTSYAIALPRQYYYWHVKTYNQCGKESAYPDTPLSFYVYVVGDASKDGIVDAADLVYLINYLYRNGPPPDPPQSADVYPDHILDSSDLVSLINYLYRAGYAPTCPSD